MSEIGLLTIIVGMLFGYIVGYTLVGPFINEFLSRRNK